MLTNVTDNLTQNVFNIKCNRLSYFRSSGYRNKGAAHSKLMRCHGNKKHGENNENKLPSVQLSMEGDDSFQRGIQPSIRNYFSIEKGLEEGCQIVQRLVDTLL